MFLGDHGQVTMEVMTLESGQGARLSPLNDFSKLGMCEAVELVWENVGSVKAKGKPELTPRPTQGIVTNGLIRFNDDSTDLTMLLDCQAELAFYYPLKQLKFRKTSQGLKLIAVGEDLLTGEGACVMVKDPQPSSDRSTSGPKMYPSTSGPSKAPSGHREVFRQAKPVIPSTSKIVNEGATLPSTPSTRDTVEASAFKRSSTTSTSELGEPSNKVALVLKTVRVTPQPTVSDGLTPVIIKEGIYSCDEYKDVKGCSVFISNAAQCSISYTLKSGGNIIWPLMKLVPSTSAPGCMELRWPQDFDKNSRMALIAKLAAAVDVRGVIHEESFNICISGGLKLWFMSAYRDSLGKQTPQIYYLTLHKDQPNKP